MHPACASTSATGPFPSPTPQRPSERRIALLVNDRHAIHHIRERGYVQSPVRVDVILREILATGLFERLPVLAFSEDHIRAVHQGSFVEYLKRACALVPEGKSIYPYVFPVRNAARPPKDRPLRAGYYCIDTFTPLNRNAWLAAERAVDCALTGARCILEGYRIAYALVRPPGHHAERRSFGGFCYLNSGAIAAHYLSRFGQVAVLDLDYHHGNGTQDTRENGRRLGLLGLPILVVQEGGYRTRSLGANACHFFAGLWEGLTLPAASSRQGSRAGASKP